ncbi:MULTISPECIES: hypothetical protein [unclassified Corallococcus]|uniref:hypothetical protein n=1 Tax=unclassified Corallococcus TaxID=2685029 RepID=UPI001A8EF76A|nr:MULTISPECIES: hypothetical protein [unclassified Corallococcus]MBN9681800.1 hypothetical protein [Corallococcus sp. NCSPR001]WAS86630.1 hypothetical protein O0N60_06550 [Corallococcus sp. NCRR]
MLQRAYRFLLSLWRRAASNPEALQRRIDAQISRAVTNVGSGNLARARLELSKALEEAPRHPGALKVQTCVLLELGALEEASQAVARLQSLTPGQPEVAVLAALVEQRSQTPAPDWRGALIQAWNRVGRPDLVEAEPFPSPLPDTTAFVERVWERTQSPEVRFTAMLADGASDAQRQWLAAHVAGLEDAALLLAAYEYFLPRSGEDALADVRRQARETLRRKIEPLIPRMHESEGPLLLLLGESAKEASLTQENIHALERIAGLPRYRRTSLAQAYADAKQRLELTAVTAPPLRVLQAAVASMVTDAVVILWTRVEATKEHLSAEDRVRLGRTVFTLGARIAEGATLSDRMLGLRHMELGAEWMADVEKLAQVKRELEHGRAVAEASSALQVDSWPLPSLHRAWLQASLDDEWNSLSILVAP